MSIEIIEDPSQWESFVEESPDKLLFHKWDFLKIMEKHSGNRLFPYGIFEKRKLICVFPLFYVKKFGLKFLNSQPYGSGIPYLGLLMGRDYYSGKQHDRESRLIKVVDEINKEITRIAPNSIYLQFGPRVDDIRPFKWSGYGSDVNYSYIIDLTLPLDSIWNAFDKKCRNEIKSAEKYSLIIKPSKDVKKFYSIMEERYSSQNLTFSKFGSDYFHDIIRSFPENIKIYFVYNDDKVINLAMNYEFNGRLVFWKGLVNLDKTIHSGEFLTWEFIKKARSDGLKTLEHQGANTRRLCYFKSKFNPSIEPYFSVTKKDTKAKISEALYSKFLQRNSIFWV